jgi:hypothetical protein
VVLFSSIALTAPGLFVDRTRTFFSPFLQLFFVNRSFPFSGLPFLMQRVIVPNPVTGAACAALVAKSTERNAITPPKQTRARR